MQSDYSKKSIFNKSAALVLPAILLLLSNCSGGEVRRSLGLERSEPDAFAVAPRPRLSVPKEFYLPVPGEDAEEPAKAQNILVPTATPKVDSEALPNVSESQLLNRLGAQQAQPDIRATLRTENKVDKPSSVLDALQPIEQGEPVVRAAAEKERLQDRRKKGEPLDGADVPVQDAGAESIWERLF